MREHAVRRLPVLEDGQVTGIVSLSDLASVRNALPHPAELAELGRVTVAA
jgi:signal-transduction protein with cAMP-binding, CBS, and nucleotidyltransferase domain